MEQNLAVMKTIESLMEKKSTVEASSLAAELCVFLADALMNLYQNTNDVYLVEETVVTVNNIIKLI